MYPRTKTSSCGRVQHYPHAVWQRAFKNHIDSDTTIGYDVPTTTRPQVGGPHGQNGIHELRGGTQLLICPFHETNQTSRMHVQLWYPIYDRIGAVKDSEDVAWIGVVAASIAFLSDISADVDDTTGPIVATDNFSKDLFASAGCSMPYLQGRVDIKADDSDRPIQGLCLTKLNMLGARYVQFYFDYDGEDFRATSSDMNTLFAEI